jgi:type I restriction enzyme M protein
VTDLVELERRLWAAADALRANTSLTPAEYRGPVLGLIFLAFAEHRFDELRPELELKATERRPVSADDFRARGVLFVPEIARLSWLIDLPESEDLGANVDLAMDAIEATNTGLRGVLPRGYQKLEKGVLLELVRLFAPLPRMASGDAFGLIYEYFLAEFAANEGRRGGEFFTPQSIVRLIVDVIEPFHGKVYDPACGSGGMFVHSARFVANHSGSPVQDLSVYGQEQKESTVPLGRMNLALHGLSGDIRLANSYYDDLHDSVGRFDFVMANPPFNVDGVDKSNLEGDTRRFPFGLPRPDNANYLWIQLFYSALNGRGRGGFVMANSASDARGSEAEIRRRLIEERAVDVMIAISPNFFYTLPIAVTLWFLDRGKRGTPREDTVLFLDARHTYRQVDRAHRDFLPEQIELLANTVRLYRGEEPESLTGSKQLMAERFPDGAYVDVAGFCKVATIEEIEAKGWSLNPGRYVGVAASEEDDGDFQARLAELYDEFTVLSNEAEILRREVDTAVQGILET